MGAYDILTGAQLCMAVAMIAYGFYFKKKRTCRVWYFSGPAWLIAIWSAVVLYYYTEYPFLTILCFLMGFFLGMGIGLWVKKGLPELTYCRERRRLQCPPMKKVMPAYLIVCVVFASFQIVGYHFSFITHSWFFNEVLGFAPGLCTGLLWGRGIAMLLDIPVRGQQVYKDI